MTFTKRITIVLEKKKKTDYKILFSYNDQQNLKNLSTKNT